MEDRDVVKPPLIPHSYDLGPPWLFKGRALYQIHLVKAQVARRFIPTELKLVEAFGYTLGGLFLAHYDDSPAGEFDELVAIAGIVWNPPTSCAWAARVLVNSHEACRHGRKEVGLPSHFAEFSKTTRGNLKVERKKRDGFFDMMRSRPKLSNSETHTSIEVIDAIHDASSTLCSIALPSTVLEKSKQQKKWMGPKLKLCLPNFSGKTLDNAHLLKYSCLVQCRVRIVEPALVSTPASGKRVGEIKYLGDDGSNGSAGSAETREREEDRDLSVSVLLSKPILALQFSCLEMHVEAPTIVSPG